MKLIKLFLEKIFPSFMDIYYARNYKDKLPKNFLDNLSKIDASSTVIDVGANKGLVSLIMSKYAKKVIAFEPNKEALEVLLRRANRNKNIDVHAAAAGTEDRHIKLFMHKDTGTSSKDYTEGSSLHETKPNVSSEKFDLVKEIDFSNFINQIDEHIEIIKIDIEGYEIELINHLVDNCNFSKIGKIYVETHENKWPELELKTRNMIKKVQASGLEAKFDFDWI